MAKVRDLRKQPFYWIDNAFLDKFGARVGLSGIAAYNAIARRANNATGEAWPGLTDIMHLTGLSKQGAINALRKLEEHGLVSIERRYDSRRRAWDSNVYKLLAIEDDVVVNSVDQGSQLSRPGVVNSVDQGSQLSGQEQYELTTPKQYELTTPNNNTRLPAVAAFLLTKYGIDPGKFDGRSLCIAAWLCYAETQRNLRNPAGYAISMARKGVDPDPMYIEVASFDDLSIDQLPQALRDEALYRQNVKGVEAYEETEKLSDEALDLMRRIVE